MNRKTILATALLAATSMAFAADKPATTPAADAPTETPVPQSDFGRDTAEQARELGTDAEARETFGADTATRAQDRRDEPVEEPDTDVPVEDPVEEEPIEDPVDDKPIDDPDDDPPVGEPDMPIEDGDDDDDIIDGDEDGDGIPDDDDGDDDGDGEIDQFEPQPANTFGQESRDAAQDPAREGGQGPEQGERAQERNELRSMDTDGDGSNDYLDTDDDGDGITDAEELDEDLDDGETEETDE